MQDKMRMNDLLDFYESLLTSRQLSIANDYYREDYSLQEISVNRSISRSAVFDSVKRIAEELEAYESKLHLLENDRKRMALYQEIKKNGSPKVQELVDECIHIEHSEENI